MRIIAQSEVVPQSSYVHLAYLSAAQANEEAARALFVIAGILVVGFYLLAKLFKKLF